MKVNKDLMQVKRMPNAIRGMLNAEKEATCPAFILGFCILAVLLILLLASVAQAEVSDKEGIRCIIGEGANQGYDGLIALSDALQNRGHVGGVYGCKAKHIDKEPAYVWKMASKAWLEAKKVDVVFGASFWGSKKIDKRWIAKMEKSGFIKTYEYKDHVFYKEGK